MSPLLGRTDHAARTLPIASSATVRAHTVVLLRDHRGPLSRCSAGTWWPRSSPWWARG